MQYKHIEISYIHIRTKNKLDTDKYSHIHTNIIKGTLTYDGVGAHFLTNHRRIAAEKHWQGGYVWPSIPLADFVHLTAVDGTQLALLAWRVNLLKLGVLLAGKATGT